MRWGDVRLSAMPAPSTGVPQIEEKSNQQDLSDNGITIGGENDRVSQQLLTASVEQQQQMLETYLLGYLVTSLQIPEKILDRNKPLAMVLDSLTALLLKSRIEEDLRVRLPIEQLFDGITIVQLTELLLNQFTLANLMLSESISVASINHEEREILSL
jgi:acyl carrier protein